MLHENRRLSLPAVGYKRPLLGSGVVEASDVASIVLWASVDRLEVVTEEHGLLV